MSRRQRHALRVIKGGFAPADSSCASRLRQRWRVGDLIFAEFTKPRNPRFHRLAHGLGELIAENLEPFAGLDGHGVLKRLQIESGVGCDEIGVNFPDVGPCMYRVPRSMSYESMDDDEFHDVIKGMCSYVAHKYWPSCSAEQIENMAECWVSPA